MYVEPASFLAGVERTYRLFFILSFAAYPSRKIRSPKIVDDLVPSPQHRLSLAALPQQHFHPLPQDGSASRNKLIYIRYVYI